MSWSQICLKQCLAVILSVCELAHTLPPELPPKVAELVGSLPGGQKLSDGGEPIAAENAQEAGLESDDDSVDPRLWLALERWREERREDYRRLSHNNHLGNQAIRHASIHFHWKAPKGKKFGKLSAWYNEVVVTSYHEDSFFNVNGHGFGYSGIQAMDVDPFVGKVVFSIWDQECTGDNLAACPPEKRAEITQCGPGITCTRFGGEGTGAKAYFLFNNWTVHTPYSFLTIAEPVGTTQVEYTGYVYGPELGGWKVMTSIKVKKGEKKWWIHGHYSFVEQWSKKNPEGVRWAKFGPIFSRTGTDSTTWWDPVIRAKLFNTNGETEDTTHIKWNESSHHFEMGIGGNIQTLTHTKMGDMFDVLPTLSCPAPLMAWVDSERATTLPTGQPVPQGVVCGWYTAAQTCAQCIPEDGDEEDCGGDCVWESDECKLDRRLLANAKNQVKCHDGGTSSIYPPAYAPLSVQVLVVNVTIQEVVYAQLEASYSLKSALESALKSVIAEEASSSTEAMDVVLSAGSVIASIQIIPPVGETPATLEATLSASSTLTPKILEGINAIPDIGTVTTGTISVSSVTYIESTVTASMDRMSKKYFFLGHVDAAQRHANMASLLVFGLLLLGERM